MYISIFSVDISGIHWMFFFCPCLSEPYNFNLELDRLFTLCTKCLLCLAVYTEKENCYKAGFLVRSEQPAELNCILCTQKGP